MTSDLSHLNYSHRFGMWQLLGMLMCIFQNSKSIGHHCVHAAVSQDEWLEWSRGAMKWNEECCMLWCDKFTGIRDSQWTASEICCPPKAWDSGTVLRDLSFSSFISPQSASLSASVLHPNSDTVRTPTQNQHTPWKHRYGTSARNQHFFLLSVVMYLSLLCRIAKLVAALRLHPIRLASQGNNILCPFVDCLEVDTPVSALTWPVNRVLTTKCSGPIFLGQLQLKSQLVDT